MTDCVDIYTLVGVWYTRVCPAVPLKLVAPGEAFSTKDPVANEGPLSSVPAQVSSQVRRLAVDFPAALHVTHVLLLFRRVIVVPVITSADLLSNHELQITLSFHLELISLLV